MKSKNNSFTAIEPKDMKYHDYLDYWLCECGNFEKEDGFMASTAQGDLISPIGARFGRCERCGCVICLQTHQIIGRNPNPERGRFTR